MFVFCKQKTAYEMRISDWSSDVCSSDLERGFAPYQKERGFAAIPMRRKRMAKAKEDPSAAFYHAIVREFFAGAQRVAILDIGIGNGEYGHAEEIGRAACRERVCPDVALSVAAGSLKKKKKRRNQV